MVKAKDIINSIEKQFPVALRAKWDLTDGLIQGDINKDVSKICLSLELRENLIHLDFDMLILHHPPKFGQDQIITSPFYDKIRNKNIIIYVIHSRLDKQGFINKELGLYLFGQNNIKTEKILEDGTSIITLNKKIDIAEAIELVKSKLKLSHIKLILKKESIKRIAIHGGEGFNQHHVLDAAKENVDLYLAGDMFHHLAENAYFYDISFIDIEHFTEQEGLKKLKGLLEKEFNSASFFYLEQRAWWIIK